MSKASRQRNRGAATSLTRERGEKNGFILALVIVAAGLLTYHNSFTGPFIFDDVKSIPENSSIRHLWPIWETLSPPHGATVEGRPVINFSLAINYAVGGTRVWGYHALNLAIHILAGCTLFGVIWRTLLQQRLRDRFGGAAYEAALTTAVLWTVHPLQTESVTYIIQRAESIMGLCYLATLYFFIRGAASSRPRVWYGLCVAACALGMASKEVMVSAPLVVLLYDRTFVSVSFREAWRRRRSLYLGLASTWVILGYLMVVTSSSARAFAMAQLHGVSRWAYLLAEPGVLVHYLQLSVWPRPICFDYYGWSMDGTGMGIVLPGLVMLTLLGASAWAWKGNFTWGILGAWFFLILAPTSSFVPTDCPAYEHRMYLPLAAVIVTVVLAIYALLGRSGLAVLLAAALGLGFLTVQRNKDYRSGLAIWSDTVAKRPSNPRAHNNLGLFLEKAGKIPEAIAQLEQALRIKPEYTDARNNLGEALVRAGRIPEAMVQLEQVLVTNPDMAGPHVNIGNALFQTGKVPEAITEYEHALRIEPDFVEAHYDLGNALSRQGRIPEAIAQLEQALRGRPEFAPAHYNLGAAMDQIGKAQEAVEHYQEALRIDPEYAEAHLGLANVLARSGRIEDAIVQYRQALQVNPDYAAADFNLGAALARSGRLEEATGYFKQALRIEPDYFEAHNSLANALVRIGKVEEGIQHYERALQINPGSAEVHYNFGVTLEHAGRVTDAAQQYEQVVKLRPDMTQAKNALLRLHAGQ